MKSPYVSELEPNRVITSSFLVQSKEIRQKKTGEFYLSLMLGDRTGELDAKMWDNVAEVLDTFDRDDFVKIKGLVQVFHNRPQLTVHKVRRMDDSEIDFADYFPSSKRDPEEMWAELRAVVAGISSVHLRGLLEALLDDPDIAQRFRRAPAAKTIHHAFLGGLIEHVLSLCALARLVAGHYKNVDADLLLTGVLLHDIGKIYELNYERGFSYSNDGQLLGHITIAVRMVGDKIRSLPDFPPRLRVLVEHMILSHHGHLEFGSPKVPQFPEAMLLHYLDDLDSKMECMRALVEHDRQLEGCFTSYSSALERTALKMDRYLAWDRPPSLSASPATGGAASPSPNGAVLDTTQAAPHAPGPPHVPAAAAHAQTAPTAAPHAPTVAPPAQQALHAPAAMTSAPAAAASTPHAPGSHSVLSALNAPNAPQTPYAPAAVASAPEAPHAPPGRPTPAAPAVTPHAPVAASAPQAQSARPTPPTPAVAQHAPVAASAPQVPHAPPARPAPAVAPQAPHVASAPQAPHAAQPRPMPASPIAAPQAPHAPPARPAPAPPTAAPVAPHAPVQHPLFAPKPESIFADKLRQALKPAAEQEG
jgi:3'-5' exoribonuclease